MLKNKWFFYITLILISLISFFIIFTLPNNGFIKEISGIIRYNNGRFVIITGISLFLAFSIKHNRLSKLFTAVILFPVFAFALNGLWANMYTEGNIIAGVLPRKDALSFFTSSISLIEKGYLVGYSSRRPMFGSFFAALLFVFKENMLLSIVSIAYMCAVVTFFALIEVKNAFNPIVAVIFFIPQFLYYRNFIGNVMSETLGFITGMAAFPFLLIAFQKRKDFPSPNFYLFLGGVFLFTLSQLVRPGAILTLPLLIVFSGWLFSEEKEKNLKFMILTFLITLIAYAMNTILFKMLTCPGSSQFSNALYGLYGVVTGGNNWSQVRRDYPNLYLLPPGSREQRILEIILSEFLSHPGDFIKGMMHQFSIIFSLNPENTYSIYSYMFSSNLLINKILLYSYYLLSIFGITNLIKKLETPINKLLLILVMGFFFSLPISPAYQAQYMRYYPATIPLLGLLPALGINFLIRLIHKKNRFLEHDQHIFDNDLVLLNKYFSIFLVSIILILPLFIGKMIEKQSFSTIGCQVDESNVVFSYYPGSEISVISYGETWIPSISAGKFKLAIHNIPDTDSIEVFESIPLPNTIFPSINLITEQTLYIVMNPERLPLSKTTYRACGVIDLIGDAPGGDGIFYPRTIEIIE